MMDRPDEALPSRDPAKVKARDAARQRKIMSNSSDKASRKNAPRIKAAASRKVRRKDKAALLVDAEAVAPVPEGLKTRERPWGTENAAARREGRRAERLFLDETPVGEGPRGRSRSQHIASSRHDS